MTPSPSWGYAVGDFGQSASSPTGLVTATDDMLAVSPGDVKRSALFSSTPADAAGPKVLKRFTLRSFSLRM